MILAREKKIFFWGALFFLGAAGAPLRADLGAALILTVESSSPTVAEPVAVRLELVNQSTSATWQTWPLDMLDQQLFFSAGPLGGTLRSLDPAMVGEPRSTPRSLAPGQSIVLEEFLHADFQPSGLAFPSPGTYQVQAQFAGLLPSDRPKISTSVAVVIEPPAPEDAAGVALFSRPDVAAFFANVGGMDTAPALIESFLASPGASPRFVPYAAYALALRQSRGEPRTEALETALATLSRADVSGHPLRARALQLDAQWSWEVGLATRAAAGLDTLASITSGIARSRALQLKSRLTASPVPPRTVRKRALTPSDSAAAWAVADALLEAFENGNKAAFLASLTEDFRYNQTLDKTTMDALLTQEFAARSGLGGVFSLERTLISSQSVGDAREVLLNFDPRVNGSSVGSPYQVRLTLVQTDGAWKVSRWDRR
jgi:hypothetical protein